MKKSVFILGITVFLSFCNVTAATFNFDKDTQDSSPPGFSEHLTGNGGPGSWRVVAASDAPSGPNVLMQRTSETNSYRFPHCIREGFTAADVDLQVRFKAVSGRKDQAAGLIWRWNDAGNYYVVRANALEDNVVLYKMQNGKRSDLKPIGASEKAYGMKVKVAPGVWHTLRVLAVGPLFTVFLDDSQLFEVQDTTFTEPGKTGLWTKADSITAFDDFSVTAP